MTIRLFLAFLVLAALLLWAGAPVWTIGVLAFGMTLAVTMPEYYR